MVHGLDTIHALNTKADIQSRKVVDAFDLGLECATTLEDYFPAGEWDKQRLEIANLLAMTIRYHDGEIIT